MKREFSIKDYLNMLLAHIKLIIILPFICAIVSYCYTVFLITPVYSTSMLLYVKNTDAASEEYTTDNIQSNPYNNTSSSTSSGSRINPYNMSTSARIAGTCALLFDTTRFMEVVINDPQLELNRGYSAGSLKGAVSFSSVDDTQILKVSVTSMNPEDTAQICRAIERQSEDYYKNYFPTGEIFLVEDAPVPRTPISPDLGTNVIYGFVGGLAVAVGISLLTGFIDTTIKPNDNLYRIYKIPVFAEILDVS